MKAPHTVRDRHVAVVFSCRSECVFERTPHLIRDVLILGVELCLAKIRFHHVILRVTAPTSKPRSLKKGQMNSFSFTWNRWPDFRHAATTRATRDRSSTIVAGQRCLTWQSVGCQYKNNMGFRFSGHETFPCRYAWLPKAFAEIQAAPNALHDDKTAMVALGLGKNMVRSLRFWLQASGVAVGQRNGVFETTDFGAAILGKRGADPFLEDQRTLWLLHWQITTRPDEPLFAWELLFNRWVQSEFSRSTVLHAFRKQAAAQEKKLSDVTLEQHFDVFLHSYVPTKCRKGEVLEDNLDCPLVELGLIQKVGERAVEGDGHREAIYGFRLEDKAGVTPEIFVFSLDDFWRKRRPQERTVTLRDVALAPGSPGQVFKLPEPAVRDRLERIEPESRGFFTYRESASTQQVSRTTNQQWPLLSRVFGREESHA